MTQINLIQGRTAPPEGRIVHMRMVMRSVKIQGLWTYGAVVVEIALLPPDHSPVERFRGRIMVSTHRI